MDYMKVIVTGRLTKDPEMQYTPEGKATTRFTLAWNGWNEKKMWLNCTAFGKTGETINQFAVKGSQVLVDGELYPADDGNPRTWTNDAGVTRATFDLTVKEFRFLGKKD